jgi:hypothetical protein
MTNNIERDIGSILARIDGLTERMDKHELTAKSTAEDISEIRDLIMQIKGGWRGLSIAGAIGGGVATLALKIGPFIAMLPK